VEFDLINEGRSGMQVKNLSKLESNKKFGIILKKYPTPGHLFIKPDDKDAKIEAISSIKGENEIARDLFEHAEEGQRVLFHLDNENRAKHVIFDNAGSKSKDA